MHKRIQNLVSILKQNNLDAVLFNPSPSLSYLSGLHFHLSRQPVVAVLELMGKMPSSCLSWRRESWKAWSWP